MTSDNTEWVAIGIVLCTYFIGYFVGVHIAYKRLAEEMVKICPDLLRDFIKRVETLKKASNK